MLKKFFRMKLKSLIAVSIMIFEHCFVMEKKREYSLDEKEKLADQY